jgi:pyruvate/2-oxoglutarate/acetoin dehydrogenase E1 component
VATLGQARVVRAGSDVTLVSAMKGVHDCLAAAELLAGSGIDVEVVDLRTMRPLDRETIIASLTKTNHIVAVEEGPLTGGWAGEVLSIVVEEALDQIDDAWRITTPDLPIPYAPSLEDRFFPGPEAIAAAVHGRARRIPRPG